jgi:choline kinase
MRTWDLSRYDREMSDSVTVTESGDLVFDQRWVEKFVGEPGDTIVVSEHDLLADPRFTPIEPLR